MAEDRPKKGDQIFFLDVESLPCDSQDPLWLKMSERMTPNLGEEPEKFIARGVEAWLMTSLMGSLGRPWMIGWALGSKDPVIVSCDGKPESEKILLQEFLAGVQGAMKKSESGEFILPWWVGFNIEDFDLPFLQQRALRHDLPQLAALLGRLRAKPWERRVIDLHKIWPRTGGDRDAFKRVGLPGSGKLETVCAVLGIELQDGIMGTNVYQAWLDNNHVGVHKHLELDIIQTREVFRRLWPVI